MKTLILLAAIILLLFSSCLNEPPEPQLPPYTQVGNNIFACKINGEIFVAAGKFETSWGLALFERRGIAIYYSNLGGDISFRIDARESEPMKAEVDLYFMYSQDKDTVDFDHTSASVTIPVDLPNQFETNFSTDKDHRGWVKIKHFHNNILAGTFEFTAINSKGEVILVTDGRFDISTN